MAREKIKKISVETLPNGYALTVGKNHYMTFNEKELAAAVFYHVLLGNEEYVNKDISENLMTAAATWPTVGDSIQGNATLMAEIKEARRETRVARKQNNSLNEKFDALKDELKELKGKYIVAKVKADQMEKYKLRAEDTYELYCREKKISSSFHKELIKIQRREEARVRAEERRKHKGNEYAEDGDNGSDRV